MDSLFVGGNINGHYVPVFPVRSEIGDTTNGDQLEIWLNQQDEVKTFISFFKYTHRFGDVLNVYSFVLWKRLQGIIFMMRDRSTFCFTAAGGWDCCWPQWSACGAAWCRCLLTRGFEL